MHFMKLGVLLCGILALTIRVGASSDFNNFGSNWDSSHTYSEIRSVEFDIIYEDTDSKSGVSLPVISGSVLYDGECYDSSKDMIYQEENAVDSFINFHYQFEDDRVEPSDEDDDDDDDNDGHSSMLSNASLRRSKSTTRRERVRIQAGGGSKSSEMDHRTYMNKVVRLNYAIQLHLRLLRQQNTRQNEQWLSQ